MFSADIRSLVDSDEEPQSAIAPSGLQNISAKVNPWTFSRMSVNLHLTLQDLARGLVDEHTRHQAERDLETFLEGLFDNTVTAEETDLVADVLRGISGPVAAKVRVRHTLASQLVLSASAVH